MTLRGYRRCSGVAIALVVVVGESWRSLKLKGNAWSSLWWRGRGHQSSILGIDDSLVYVPVLLGFTQEDLDSLSADCISILQSASLKTHLVSDAGDLLIPYETLEGISQRVLDGLPVESYDENALLNCLRRLFGNIPGQTVPIPVSGRDVMLWFKRFLVQERVSAQKADTRVDRDRCVIAQACLPSTAKGEAFPEDIPI